MTTIEEEREAKMVWHLKEAVALGYTMATPGSSDAVRASFPDYFVTDKEREGVSDYLSDEVNLDDHPMVSHGDEGYWVSAWLWVAEEDDEEEDDEEEEDEDE